MVDLIERQSRLGATDIACVLGLSPWRSEWELWAEKTGRIEPAAGNQATSLGSRFESAILDIAEDELGPLERNILCFASGIDCPIASTLDARVKSTGVPCEAKTAGLTGPLVGDWGDKDTDSVPIYYLVQVSVQMMCSEAGVAYLYALLSGRGIVRYQIHRDDTVIKEIAERCSRWWENHIIRGIEPTHTEPLPLDVVKRLRRQPNKTVELFDDALLAVAEYEAAKAVKSAAEKTCEVAQAKVLSLLGDAEAGRLQDGRTVNYMIQKRRGYQVLDTEFRVLRIKKA